MRKKHLLKKRRSLMPRRSVCCGGFRMLSKSLLRKNRLTPRSRRIGRLLVNELIRSCKHSVKILSGCLVKKRKISEEAEQARVASQKREEEYLQRIAKLEKFAEGKVAECKASELLAEEVSADCKWLLSRAVPLIAERIAGSEELAKYMYELGEAACDLGRKEGYAEGRAAAESKEPLKDFELYKTDCVWRYAKEGQEFASLEFGVVKAAQKLSRKPDGIALLKKALNDEDP
ncbi:hypothetical protein Hdeb2414_s0014g00422671 [Helianthus debilis subsp. tardiflorus]